MSYLEDISCESILPMGRAGSVVARIPVLLTKEKITFSFIKNFSLLKNSKILKKTFMTPIIDSICLDKNNFLRFYGRIEKKIYYEDVSSKSKFVNSKILSIPLEKKVPIHFFNKPYITEKLPNLIYQQSNEPLICNINYIEVLEDSITNSDSSYSCFLTLLIDFEIYQNQNIFISEPDGNVILLSENSQYNYCDNSQNLSIYNIGYHPSIGIVASDKINF